MLPSNPVWRDDTTTGKSPQAWNHILTWLIIVLVVIVAVGPVLYLLPNAKDKRLTALREQARQLGLTVQITSLSKLDPPAHEQVTAGGKTLQPRNACTAYRVPVRRNLSAVEEIQLLRIPSQPTMPYNEVTSGWALDADSSLAFWQAYVAPAQALSKLLALLAKLPEDTLAVGMDDRSVSCYWLEKAQAEGSVVSDMRDVLDELAEDLGTRFGAVVD
jgi:hypothetical protein